MSAQGPTMPLWLWALSVVLVAVGMYGLGWLEGRRAAWRGRL